MSKIRIEAITDVHVGSGETLVLNNDYCIGKDSEGYSVVGIISPAKVMKLIGEQNIDTWVTGIERHRPIQDIVRQFAPDATVSDFSLRTMNNYTGKRSGINLKTQMHDALNRPYIPGSSIKGAIRTAVLAQLTSGLKEKELRIGRPDKPSSSEMEKKFFGNDPNSDIFRFLTVGDAFFGELMTTAITMVNINERRKQSFWDESKPLNIEVITEGDGAEEPHFFEMRLKTDNYNFSKKHWPDSNNQIGSIPQCMRSLNYLFSTINAHTCALLQEEIEYWNERCDKDDTDIVERYIEKCQNILSQARSCKDGNSCILRVGHGSGWRFITGAWTERYPDFWKIKNASRPKNSRYSDYEFPKSRRVEKVFDDDGEQDCGLLGFVKLTIERQ